MRKQVELAVEIMKKGGIVAYPTDTIYGLGADIRNDVAVQKIFAAKRRPANQPLPILLADVSQVENVARDIPDVARRLAQQLWPGSLTIVLHRSNTVPDAVTGGGDKVAVRIPQHPVPIALIRGLGTPITGTSANVSGKPNPVSAHDVRDQLGDCIDMIIDGGRCPGDTPSTVVDVTGEYPAIIRDGAIPREEIEAICQFTAKAGSER